jgi:N-acetylglucosamine kinase-like BadF-type ATPase
MSQKIIIDAGATKTAFAVVRDGIVLCEHTGKGINPNYTSDKDIFQVMETFVRSESEYATADEVFYYGAGCASLENAGRMGCLLQSFFPESKIHVYSDLMAVCHALSRGRRSIVGILGTGAATCLFDGTYVENRAPSLGYMLGDEGSGTNLGKRLLTAYLRGQLSPELESMLMKIYNVSFSDVIHCLYRESEPNRFMASFAPFVRNHLDDPLVRKLAIDAFRDFFSIQKSYYEEAETLEWNLSGSVAYHFQEIVREAADHEHCRVGEIIEAPLPLLVKQ